MVRRLVVKKKKIPKKKIKQVEEVVTDTDEIQDAKNYLQIELLTAVGDHLRARLHT